ncbi:hypothetical protein KEM54_002865 [Ascosphaera aggregata]|nr:hypothetical protein KEM54_002865 [Ascosphaera aggregata]
MIVTVGVLALQGAFLEHIKLLRDAVKKFQESEDEAATVIWNFIEVRTPTELARVHRKPTWGTCAGLIMLAESANRTKRGGQELIGGLDIRVNRNYFGRQTDSFVTDLRLPFLSEKDDEQIFPAVFIRAPIVETVLPHTDGVQAEEQKQDNLVVAPSRQAVDQAAKNAMSNSVDVLARLTRHKQAGDQTESFSEAPAEIVAVKQGNVFGTSFHPELTDDSRIHMWWLQDVIGSAKSRSA